MKSWIGVDLDGTLAHYDGYQGETHIGKPIPKMLEKVKGLLAAGKTVKIFTARASSEDSVTAIEAWCKKHIGQVLEVTDRKDYGMLYLYDDRCVQVEKNTGKILGDGWD